jgi:hypothetical protein
MFQYDGEIHIIDFEDNLAYVAKYLDDDIPEVTKDSMKKHSEDLFKKYGEYLLRNDTSKLIKMAFHPDSETISDYVISYMPRIGKSAIMFLKFERCTGDDLDNGT